MSLKKWIRKKKTARISIRMKLTLSLLSIAAVLLISSCITLLQYRSMSNYVSNLIADNIRNVNLLEQLSDDVHAYNAQVMAVLWDEANTAVPTLDVRRGRAMCDSLMMQTERPAVRERIDSLRVSFEAFAARTRALPDVVKSPSSTLDWYTREMQPLYDRLSDNIVRMRVLVYEDLEANSATFDRGFYRSIIPGAVALAVGLLLILLLLLFMSIYYITPLNRMLRSLDDYRLMNKKYACTFEGDDELSRLNDGISEVVGENVQLRKRVSYLRETLGKQ